MDNGEVKEEIQFLDYDDQFLSHQKGSYCLEFRASPLCEDGSLYQLPSSQKFIVNEIDNQNICHVLENQEFNLKIQYPYKIDECDIDIAIRAAKLIEDQADKADAYAKTTREARDTALAANDAQGTLNRKNYYQDEYNKLNAQFQQDCKLGACKVFRK